MLLEPVDPIVLAIADQAEGQLVALEQDGVWVLLLLCDGITKCAERLLADDTAVGKPFAIGLDSCVGCVAALERGGLCDFALGVARGSALLEDVELLDLLCGAVEILSAKVRQYNEMCWALPVGRCSYPLILKLTPPLSVPSRTRRLASFLKLPIVASEGVVAVMESVFKETVALFGH